MDHFNRPMLIIQHDCYSNGAINRVEVTDEDRLGWEGPSAGVDHRGRALLGLVRDKHLERGGEGRGGERGGGNVTKKA